MTRRILLLVALATQAACRPNLAQEPDAAFRARVDSAIASTDTTRLADLAELRCRSRGDDARSCYEDYFLSLADSGRVRLALGALADLGAENHQIEADGHAYTHVIGIRAWRPGDDVGTVFRSCTPLYQSGCYHGVIQSYLTATGAVDSARAAGLCDAIAPSGVDNWLRFQCVHGLGHGLEMAWNWDLPRALGGCDWLASTWDRDSCYGGAVMENAVASQPGGHHTAVRALEATGDDHGMTMEHGGHMMSGPPTFKMRDSLDALYPCDSLDTRYQRSCYLGHGGILLGHVGGDFGKAAAECDRVDAELRNWCYMSLGTNASGMTVRNTQKSIAYCSEGDPDYRFWCFIGAVKNFIDVSADPADGIAFCREVPEGNDRERCWNAVGEELAVLYTTDLMKREAVCASTGEGERMCRQGAGLAVKIPDEAKPQS
jgi:hypothetical protein